MKLDELPSYCRDWVLSEVIEKADSLEGSGNWHERKFFLTAQPEQ